MGLEALHRSLLLVKANGVDVVGVSFDTSAGCGKLIALVELAKSVRGFRLNGSKLKGDNLHVEQGPAMTGTLGLLLNAKSQATLKDVEILETSNAGVMVEPRATLRATNTHVHHTHGTGFWVRGGWVILRVQTA